MSLNPFARDYGEARARFRAAAAAAGATLQARPGATRGPDGATLTTEVARLGPREAGRVLVIISGTHGAEGFAGAGVQLALLTRPPDLPADTALLLIHGLNSHGFAWLRRVTEENIDLNRNWIDFAQPLPANPAYDQLADAVVPSEWRGPGRAAAEARLAAYVEAHGQRALDDAIGRGQYHHPTGLFYGGAAPSAARVRMEEIVSEGVGQAREIAVIDLHTGLGPYGFGERIVVAAPDGAEARRLGQWYGGGLTSVPLATSTAAPAVGDMLSALPRLLPQAAVTGIALEFGTRPRAEVRAALRADAGLYAHGDPTGPEGDAVRHGVRNAYYPDEPLWHGMVLGQSLTLIRQALAGLAGS